MKNTSRSRLLLLHLSVVAPVMFLLPMAFEPMRDGVVLVQGVDGRLTPYAGPVALWINVATYITATFTESVTVQPPAQSLHGRCTVTAQCVHLSIHMPLHMSLHMSTHRPDGAHEVPYTLHVMWNTRLVFASAAIGHAVIVHSQSHPAESRSVFFLIIFCRRLLGACRWRTPTGATPIH